jgi:2-polyprenyl-3-methyl-5-hydroxy-6-metoxy-1,4-benzoquinol methylase
MKTEPQKFTPIAIPNRSRSCPACGADALEYASDYPSNVKPFALETLLYCTACGLAHVPDSSQMLADYYLQDYAQTNRKDRDVNPEIYFSEAHRESSQMMRRYYARARAQVIRLKKHEGRFNRVLDFGSGPGYLLHISHAREPHAYEPDQESKKYLDYIGARQYDALDEIPQGYFDVIVASHTVEHLVAEELIETLRHLVGALRPHGLMLIEVPQGGHSYLHLEGARQDPHTLFFTPQALVEAVTRAGGDIVFAGAVAKPEIPRRDKPIYTPEGSAFNKVNRGGLTVICRPPQSD